MRIMIVPPIFSWYRLKDEVLICVGTWSAFEVFASNLMFFSSGRELLGRNWKVMASSIA